MVEQNRREELEKLDSQELKDYFKNRDMANPTGFWKMTKEQMIEEILNNETADDDIEEVENSKPQNAIQTTTDDSPDSSSEDDKKPVKSTGYIFKAIDPNGNVKFESGKLNDVVKFSMENGIASRGWVALSIKRNIPVMIGLGRDQELTEDFEPRTTQKYSGNYWRFMKEKVSEDQ